MGLIDKFKAYLNEEEPAEEEVRQPKKTLTEEMPTVDEAEDKPAAEKKSSPWKGLFKKRKNKEVQETLDLDDEDVLAQMKGTHTVNAEVKAVRDFCEQLVDVSFHMEDMRKEYQIITGYLTDIQRIEELPIEMANEIIEIAKKIEMLDKSRETYLQSEELLSMEQYKIMVKYEDEIPDTIQNLIEMELRDSMLKNDMGHLEGEKESLKYRREDCANGISRIRSLLMTILVLALLTCVCLFCFSYAQKKAITFPILVVGSIAFLFFAISYAKYVDYKAEIKEIDAKRKRAISLLNKVKAKYINNTNTLDYIYDKYDVNSGKELEYNWSQYNIMLKDAMKYNQANSNFKAYCDMLVEKMTRIGLRDPLVWPKQTTALIDRREMVEIKHALNVRRQKLRDKMTACEKIRDNAKIALKAAVEINPAMEQFIKEILTPFKVKLEDN